MSALRQSAALPCLPCPFCLALLTLTWQPPLSCCSHSFVSLTSHCVVSARCGQRHSVQLVWLIDCCSFGLDCSQVSSLYKSKISQHLSVILSSTAVTSMLLTLLIVFKSMALHVWTAAVPAMPSALLRELCYQRANYSIYVYYYML